MPAVPPRNLARNHALIKSIRHILPLVLLAASIAPAHADFKVCNKTGVAAQVALGRFNGTHWMSEGWWQVAPHKCTTLVKGKLKARYYYLYASNGGDGGWDGNRSFCTSVTDKFTVIGRASCAKRGYDRKGFFAVDTRDHLDFTQSLSD